MKFFHNGHLVELRDDDASTLHLFSPPQVHRLLRKDGASAYFHIAITTTELPSSPNISHLLPKIQPLITKSIPCFTNSNPYLHLIPQTTTSTFNPTLTLWMLDHIDTLTFRNKKLKAKLRTCCRKGLSVQASALSRPLFFWSRSTMGPGIFLDYRALNAITVKDHFPIPMIDELLDELGSASWFSNWIFYMATIKFGCMNLVLPRLLFEPTMTITSSRWCHLVCAIHLLHFKLRWMKFSDHTSVVSSSSSLTTF